ncbi:hypothetical protein [Streptomyces sp. NPDC055085]
MSNSAATDLVSLYGHFPFVEQVVVRVVLADNLTGDDPQRFVFVRIVGADFGPEPVHLTAMCFKLLAGRLHDAVELPQPLSCGSQSGVGGAGPAAGDAGWSSSPAAYRNREVPYKEVRTVARQRPTLTRHLRSASSQPIPAV